MRGALAEDLEAGMLDGVVGATATVAAVGMEASPTTWSRIRDASAGVSRGIFSCRR